MIPKLMFSIGLSLCIATSAIAQSAVSLILTQSDTPVTAGGEAIVSLVVLNSGTAPTTVDLPGTLVGSVVHDGQSLQVTLNRRDGGPREMPVAAGGFARATYGFNLPASLYGNVAVQIDAPLRARTLLLIPAPASFANDASASTPAHVTTSLAGTSGKPLTAADQNNRSGFVEYFADHFSGHEPVYILVGQDRPNAKFQVSFKYRVLNPEGSWTEAFSPLGGLHLAYSQTSFWDLEGDSKPFYDNSYRPEVLFAYDHILPKDWAIPGVSRVGLQFGVQHESNGRAGEDSRSMNIAYVRPIFVFGDEKGLFLTLAPRIFSYIGDLSDNPDIEDYRGHADLRGVVGWDGGLQLAAIGRLGDDGSKGSLQLDLTYPLRQRLAGNVDIYLHGQLFTGYGESLLRYNDADTTFRLGISMVR